MHAPLRHEPAAWTTVHTLNACSGCLHAVGQSGALRCSQAEVCQANGGVPMACDDARSHRGLCGPEARFLDMASWH